MCQVTISCLYLCLWSSSCFVWFLFALLHPLKRINPTLRVLRRNQLMKPLHNKVQHLGFSFCLAVFFSMFLSSNLMELGPLLIKEVYQVNIGNSALGMAISAIISIFMLESAGRWMQRSGPFKVWYAAQVIYLIVGTLILVNRWK